MDIRELGIWIFIARRRPPSRVPSSIICGKNLMCTNICYRVLDSSHANLVTSRPTLNQKCNSKSIPCQDYLSKYGSNFFPQALLRPMISRVESQVRVFRGGVERLMAPYYKHQRSGREEESGRVHQVRYTRLTNKIPPLMPF